ncbi:MAG: RNA methyltransferase [Clostridium sp.]|nr:RNA methyltransferase [Clostridium sp.]
MNNIIRIDSLSHPGLAPYCALTDAQLANKLHPDQGLFIAESPKVIKLALDAGMRPLSMLCEEKHIEGDAKDIISRCPGLEIFTGPRETLSSLTGYKLTRGVLCAFRRPALPAPADVCAVTKRVAVIDGVCDTTNIGAIFRSAAALGIDAVLLTRTSCDPLNRRAVRVSMGTIFQIPWTWIDSPDSLRTLGFKTVAMALTDDSLPIDSPLLSAEPRLAIILGTEGDGLSRQAIANADFVARIPMSHGVDSLNVAAASAVAFYQLTK